ncbi:MAG TPA: hypothetical protein VFA65_20480 [Bryobacteraceae bacterium]|nr:hypothetical protein [Bryobacteraceae bacterium]
MPKKKAKSEKPVATLEKIRICNRCGQENPPSATHCDCGSSRFAPSWVIAKRPINRQFGVEVTETNPEYGDIQKRITLSKWWPGGRSSLHIPSLVQWDAIVRIIDTELRPFVGWEEKTKLVMTVKEKRSAGENTASEVKTLVAQHPDVVKQVIAAIDISKINTENLPELLSMAGQLADAVSGFDQGFRNAFIAVVKKLPQQRKRALEDLEALLETWSLHQVTAVAQQVKGRLNTIELFKNQVLDERTYEINGPNSIHRILERSMWLIDERYWLLQSNETLRKFIGEEMAKNDRKKFGAKRPDFACGTVGDKLIILELKRPSHTLKVDDLNQLETYLTVAEKYKKFRGYEGYLIGSRIDDDLARRIKHRSSSYQLLTYSDLLDDAQKRYRDYLKAMEE